MNAYWIQFKTWFKAKFGRIVTSVGFLLASAEGFDVSMIKDPLENLIGHLWALRITAGLFLLSWARHQYVARKVPTP
ncbi:MAG: hypothetical protein JWO52_7824 [Gammaproteobacteria bacterium]|nr:hypothetical protein [Gammaproteobacteria bacterium]